MLFSSLIPPRWEGYKLFFQVAILRYLVLWFSVVPIIVQFVESTKSSFTLNIGGKPVFLDINPQMPFSWEILWVSSFFFFLALVIYHWRCPEFIKRYNTFNDYLSVGHDPRWLAWEAEKLIRDIDKKSLEKFADRLTTKKYVKVMGNDFTWEKSKNPLVGEQQTTFFFKADQQTIVLAMPVRCGDGKILADAERGIFWEIFGRFSDSRFKSRVSVFVLLILSALTFACVLLQHVFTGLLLIASN